MIRYVPLIALCLLAACNGEESPPPAGAVTADEAKALDEAAEMIPPQKLAASPGPEPSE